MTYCPVPDVIREELKRLEYPYRGIDVANLMDSLPYFIGPYRLIIGRSMKKNQWFVCYRRRKHNTRALRRQGLKPMKRNLIAFNDESLPKALALTWIYIAEKYGQEKFYTRP